MSAEENPTRIHFAIRAPSEEAVTQYHEKAISAGIVSLTGFEFQSKETKAPFHQPSHGMLTSSRSISHQDCCDVQEAKTTASLDPEITMMALAAL